MIAHGISIRLSIKDQASKGGETKPQVWRLNRNLHMADLPWNLP